MGTDRHPRSPRRGPRDWTAPLQLDYSEIHDALRMVVPPGSTFELRLLGERKGQVDSGYFNTTHDAATAICSAQGWYKGMYFTPNPVLPDLLARSANHIKPWAQTTTLDPEIVRRRWLLLDIDPRRPANISSSDAEHTAALNKASTIKATLTALYGFPDPMVVDSGNGAHLLIPMNEENSDEVRDEVQTFLRIAQVLFKDETCEIDPVNFNAARIWRVPGTWARKGDSTPDRPHRRSKVLSPPDPFRSLSIVDLLRFNATYAHLVKSLTPNPQKVNRHEYPADEKLYQRLNEYAMHNVKSWVTHFFPDAREYKEGFRVASSDIGEVHEEDLTIHPWPLGIKYFGVADQGDGTEGRRTPISVIAEYSLHSDKATAANALGTHLNFPITELGPIVAGHGGTASSVQAAPLEGMGGLLGANVRPKFDFKTIRTIADLQSQQFKPITWIVKDVLPAGNMLLAARPKMRKTWLALQLSMAVASGRKFLDWETVQGEVLFLALEDNERRLKDRINILQRFDLFPPDLSGFRYWTGGMGLNGSGHLVVTDPEEAARTLSMFPRGEAGVEALDQYLDAFPKTTMIVIDTLAHFRGPRMSRDVYQSDYDSMMPLTKLAARRNVLVMPVTHEKKGNADRDVGGDFLEDVTGSAGMTGGTDGVISIKGRRGAQDENESRKILISGRDVPHEYQVDMAFDAERGGWLKSAREDVKVSIRRLLGVHPILNQRDMLILLPNAGQSRLYQALTEMKLEAEIVQGQYGYSLKR
jgi:hypothetical protein